MKLAILTHVISLESDENVLLGLKFASIRTTPMVATTYKIACIVKTVARPILEARN